MKRNVGSYNHFDFASTSIIESQLNTRLESYLLDFNIPVVADRWECRLKWQKAKLTKSLATIRFSNMAGSFTITNLPSNVLTLKHPVHLKKIHPGIQLWVAM